MSVKMGKAKFGGEKKNHFKLKDGEQTYRILPPLFDLADEGRWSVFWNVHFGYRNSKGEMRTFQSPLVKNRKTKMIDSPDAALERIETLKEQLEKAKAAGNKVAIDTLMELVGSQKAKYNMDNNHHMNVMDEQGNIGELKIRHRCKLALDITIKELRDQGIDPLSADNGRLMTFKRSGMGLDTNFKVTVKKRKLQVAGVGEVEQDIVHVLTPDIINRLEKEAFELNKLHREPTSEEVERIVKSSDLLTGKSSAVDEIFDTKPVDPNVSDEGPEDEGPQAQGAPQTAAGYIAPVQPTAAAYVAPVQPVQAAPVVSAPVQPLAPAVLLTPATTPVVKTQSAGELSDQEFLKSLGM